MTITGIEFDGIKVLEVVPWDGMYLNIPKSVYSLRISKNQSFSESSDDWNIVISNNNNIHEICLWSIDNFNNIDGLSYLNKLESIVIKTTYCMDGKFSKISNIIYKLAYYSPIKYVSCLWNKEKLLSDKLKDTYNNLNFDELKFEFNSRMIKGRSSMAAIGNMRGLGLGNSYKEIYNNNKVLNVKHSVPTMESEVAIVKQLRDRRKREANSPILPKYIDVRKIKQERESDMKQGYETLCSNGLTPHYYFDSSNSNSMKFSDLYNHHSDKNSSDKNNKKRVIHPNIVSIIDGYTVLKKLSKMDLTDSDFQEIIL